MRRRRPDPTPAALVGPAAGRAGKLPVIAAIAALLLLIGVIVQQLSVGQVRAIEQSYVHGRQVTACATEQLSPFASGRSLDELPDTLEELVVDAHAETTGVRAELRQRTGGLRIPPVAAATDAVRDALDAEVRLYAALVDDPTGSEDELTELGRANARAERRLATARRWLLIEPGEGWNDRFRCRTDAGGD